MSSVTCWAGSSGATGSTITRPSDAARTGSRVEVSVSMSPVRNADGMLVGISSIARDVSERNRVGRALRESERRFRTLTDHSPVGVFLTDAAGRCTYTNARCQKIYGFSFEEGLGEGWTRFIHPEDRAG